MITLNDKKYEQVAVKVTYGKYDVKQNGQQRVGVSPIIEFKFDDILLGIETTYDREWLKELKINDKQDISKYVSDVPFEDEQGFISLIGGICECYITRVSETEFIIDLNLDTNDSDDIKIILNEKVTFDIK